MFKMTVYYESTMILSDYHIQYAALFSVFFLNPVVENLRMSYFSLDATCNL